MKQRFIILIILLLTAVNLITAQEPQIIQKRFETGFALRDSVDNIGNLYIHYPSQHSSVLTFVNSDGTVSVCTSDDSAKITWVYEFSMDLTEIKRLSFQNETGMLGAFTKDNEGNYYFFFSRRAASGSEENMIIVKYNKDGGKLNTFKMKANPGDGFSTIKIPYDAGTCRLEVSGSLLAVYFAHERFDGHQASFGFVIDKDSFTRVDRGHAYYYQNGTYPRGNNLLPFTGHSFNQFILPIENGFVIADHGDAYPRAFTFGKFLNGSNTVRLNAFRFPGGTGDNATYAQMGGLAKTSAGFIFAGTYGTNRGNPRNIFILTFPENLASCSNPLYITNYTKDDGHAGHPKIVSMGNGKYLLMWEFFSFSTQAANIISSVRTGFLSVHAAVINESGALLSDIYKLNNPLRLNINDVLRFNPKNGFAYWAVNDTNNSIIVYGFKAE